MFSLVFAILGLLPGLPQTGAPPEGVITVNVADEKGSPLVDATVWMLSMDGGMRLSPVPVCLTDATGACSRAHLPVGRYLITAMKEAEGYPNGEFPLFNRNRAHVIAVVQADKLNVHVSYMTGPKAATILVNVVDSVTGAQIESPTVLLRSPIDPNISVSTSRDPKSRVLVPPDEDVLVEVSAEGYKPWHMEMQPGAAYPNTLRLRSEETREFTIRLQPK